MLTPVGELEIETKSPNPRILFTKVVEKENNLIIEYALTPSVVCISGSH